MLVIDTEPLQKGMPPEKNFHWVLKTQTGSRFDLSYYSLQPNGASAPSRLEDLHSVFGVLNDEPERLDLVPQTIGSVPVFLLTGLTALIC